MCYRNNGSRLAYSLFKRILKIDYVSLPNLITNSPVVAEQLLHHCNPDEVDARLAPLLDATPSAKTSRRGISICVSGSPGRMQPPQPPQSSSTTCRPNSQ